ncbi:MAG TPA: hypothetical protein VHM00_10290 [Caldimonas sp.]|nr:hypothetical protein [Caldimonas sp.]HEX2541458.1 hypothetical protein [Caldimonas sp.]
MAVISAGVALVYHLNVRTEAALQRGDDLIGRWRIDAPTWRAFFDIEQGFALQPNVWQNEFQPRRDVPDDGAEVTVGTTGVVVDGSVHRLPRHGVPEVTAARLRRDTGPAPTVELHLYHPPMKSGDRWVPEKRTTLRFPVAASAEGVAARYVAWCESGRPGEAGFFHGRGDGSDAEDLSTCRSCGWQTHKFISRCERCGGAMLSRRWTRRFGGVQFVLGVLLAGIIGWVLWAGPGLSLLNPGGSSSDGTRFSSTPGQAMALVTILGAVDAIGILSTLNGLWQLSTGRPGLRPRQVKFGLLGLVGLILVAVVALAALGR